MQIQALRKSNGTWGREHQKRIDTLADHLESRFQLNPGAEDLQELRPNDYNHKILLGTPKQIK